MTVDGYRLIDHTADLGVEIWAADPQALFIRAARTLFDLLVGGRGQSRSGAEPRRLTIQGQDQADLMINWLRELLYIWNAEQQVLTGVRIETLSDTEISAQVAFERFAPRHHEARHDIKAVTYHQTAVGPCDAGWCARIIFDI